jgi:hypothetical protein
VQPAEERQAGGIRNTVATAIRLTGRAADIRRPSRLKPTAMDLPMIFPFREKFGVLFLRKNIPVEMPMEYQFVLIGVDHV